MTEKAYEIMKQFSPTDFPAMTNEDKIRETIKFGGMHGRSLARTMVYKDNAELFKNWDEKLLGDRVSKLDGTRVYNSQFTVSSQGSSKTITDCVNKDCVEVAYSLVKKGLNPAIHNLASNVHPCGGYNKGTNAQEESISYMSTLSQSLYQYGDPSRKHIRESGVQNKGCAYPLDVNFGGIYSPNVRFFRNNESDFYSFREDPFECGVITVASLANRANEEYYDASENRYFNPDGTLTDDGKEIETNKIRTVYRIALDNGIDSLVLGAFGCGVYNLLPEEVAQIFYDVLQEPEFNGKFKEIVFAILEKKRGKQGQMNIIGKDGKFKRFYELFQRKQGFDC